MLTKHDRTKWTNCVNTLKLTSVYYVFNPGPSVVGAVKKDWASPNSIALSWQQPEQTVLPILDYEIKYYEKVHWLLFIFRSAWHHHSVDWPNYGICSDQRWFVAMNLRKHMCILCLNPQGSYIQRFPDRLIDILTQFSRSFLLNHDVD